MSFLQETAALLPDELAPNREALMAVQAKLRNSQRRLIKFLYEGNVNDKTMIYYDPENYPITDAHAITLLKIPNYSRALSGVWCITPANLGRMEWAEGLPSPTFSKNPPIFIPAVLDDNKSGCIWKVVPHARSLVTIQNVHGCPNGDFCGAYWVFGHPVKTQNMSFSNLIPYFGKWLDQGRKGRE